MKKALPALFTCLFIPIYLLGQIIENIEELSHVPFSAVQGEDFICGDVWGFTQDDKEFAVLARTEYGVSIIDVTDPENPVVAANIPKPVGSSRLYHAKYYNGYIYAVMRPGPLQIIDARDPYQAVAVAEYSSGFTDAYVVFIADSVAYLADVDGPRNGVNLLALDITQPESPVELGTYSRTYHHVYVRNDTLFGFLTSKGAFDVLDVSDPANITPLLVESPVGSECHSGWLHDNGDWLTTDQETPGGHLKVWDISNLSGIAMIGEFSTPTNNVGETTIHHSRWYFDLIYTSYWQDGFRLIDGSDPANLVQLAAYDNIDPNSTAMYRGAWGCYPYLPSRHILISDPQNGLYVLDYASDGPGLSHDPVESIPAGPAKFRGRVSRLNGPLVDLTDAHVYWRTDDQPGIQKTEVQSAGLDDEYFFEITLNTATRRVEYYLQIAGNIGQKTRVPGLAPFLDFYTLRRVSTGQVSYNDLEITEVSDAQNQASEFLELYNYGSQPVDITGFKLVQYSSGQDMQYNYDDYHFDFGSDEAVSGSSTVPARGFLVIARGSDRGTFENEWGSLPGNCNFNSGNSSLQFGDLLDKRWILYSGGNPDRGDGAIIDDTGQAVAGQGEHSFKNDSDQWITETMALATPGDRNQDQSLPVELSAFTASAEAAHILIEWQTQSEIENSGFILLKRGGSAGTYYELASYSDHDSLRGLGSSPFGKSYHYLDREVATDSTYWYLLRSVSTSGRTEDFGPVKVRLQSAESFATPPAILNKNLSLYQNYPNPFNPSTTIRLEIKQIREAQPFSVEIYDSRGLRIRTLFKGRLAAGQYQLNWNGKNFAGEPLASGVYFYSVQSPWGSLSRKMLLLR